MACRGTALLTDWTTGRSRFDPQQRQRVFLLASVSRPALMPTQSPVQWVQAVLSSGVKRGRGVTLTTHPHLMSRSWMSRAIYPLPLCLNMYVVGLRLHAQTCSSEFLDTQWIHMSVKDVNSSYLLTLYGVFVHFLLVPVWNIGPLSVFIWAYI
jgi:hypothetical protein